MKDDDEERRAKALADVILEFLPIADPKDPNSARRDRNARTIAEDEAYWIVYSLDDPAGELGLWNVNQQEALLDKALNGLREVDAALSKLASPVATAVSRNTSINPGLVIPSPALNALAARRVRLKHLPHNEFPTPSESAPFGCEAELIEDAADSSKEITVYIGTVSQTAPVLIRRIRKALLDTKEKIDGVVAQSLSRSTSQGRDPNKKKTRLDHRRWSAIRTYLGLRELWEKYQNRAPARFPKDDDPFYRFAERALEVLEIKGIGGREHASVRSVLDALGELKKQGIILLPELDEK